MITAKTRPKTAENRPLREAQNAFDAVTGGGNERRDARARSSCKMRPRFGEVNFTIWHRGCGNNLSEILKEMEPNLLRTALVMCTVLSADIFSRLRLFCWISAKIMSDNDQVGF